VKRLAMFAAPFLLWSWTAVAQQPPRFREKVDVNVVLLDAIVTDSKGQQILGLDQKDFVVKENGVEQTLDTADYFTNRQLLNAQETNAPFKVERTQQARYFVFFFDKPEGSALWDRLASARKATRDFIEKQMKPGDLIAVVGHDVRLKVYSDFTSDKQQLLAAVDEVGRFGKGLTSRGAAEGPSILRSVNPDEMMSGSGTVYEGLDVLGQALRSIPARKNLFLFSAGIYERGQEIRNGLIMTQSRYYEPMIESLNSANVTVYAMNLQRNDGGDMPAIHQTLEQIAADTSGDYYRHPVSFEPLLKIVEKLNNGYYLLTYRSNHPQRSSGFQRVEVSIRSQPQLRVKAREGYAYGLSE
jgi:VWFA-related protein